MRPNHTSSHPLGHWAIDSSPCSGAPGSTQATISSVADNKSETWTVPSGANTCKQTGGTIDISCAYVVTTSTGVNTITLTASTTTSLDVMIYAASVSSGSIALDSELILQQQQ